MSQRVLITAGAAGIGRQLDEALEALARRGVTRLLCEGGPRLADRLAGEGLVDT